MIDDYLSRNGYVVIANLGKDNFDCDILDEMIAFEHSHRNRISVLNALEAKIKRCK